MENWNKCGIKWADKDQVSTLSRLIVKLMFQTLDLIQL